MDRERTTVVQTAERILGGRYALEELIASGGMGQVWRGRDTLLGRQVAVKVLRSEYTGDPTFLERFRAEAHHAAALQHPNIAAVYDYGEAPADGAGEHVAYLVMELVDGEPLSTRLREGGPLSPEETLSVLRQAAVALAEAHHAGLVHRDVKPGNILVTAGEQVKITDFGIAWSAGSVPLTRAGQVIGTPQYLSPELAVGEPPSPASDVYSLGLVGYECLTGEPAFDGENPVSIALKQVQDQPEPLPEDLPAGLRHLVDVAVAKDPAERPPDGDAFVAAIDRVRAGRPLEGGPGPGRVPLVGAPAAPAAPHRPDRRRRRLRNLLPAVLALLVGVGVVVLVDHPGRGGSPGAGAPVVGTSQPDQSTVPIVLHAADYLGRPVDEVTTELSGLGLVVARQQQVTDAAAPGAVTALSPVGQDLHPGDGVTVSFAAPQPVQQAGPSAVDDGPAPAAGAPGNDSGRGAGTATAGSPATVDVPAGTADVPGQSTTSASAPAATGSGAPSASSAPASSAPPSAGGSASETEPSGSAAPTGSSPASSAPATSEPATGSSSAGTSVTGAPASTPPASTPAGGTPGPSTPAQSTPVTGTTG